jgi:hypothetical protein
VTEGKITIRTQSGEVTINALLFGPLAVHGEYLGSKRLSTRYWAVSHRESGMQVVGNVSKEMALDTASSLCDLQWKMRSDGRLRACTMTTSQARLDAVWERHPRDLQRVIRKVMRTMEPYAEDNPDITYGEVLELEAGKKAKK